MRGPLILEKKRSLMLRIILRHIYIMGRKSSYQRKRFIRCSPIDSIRMPDCSVFEFSYHQTIEKLPQNATEIVGFL